MKRSLIRMLAVVLAVLTVMTAFGSLGALAAEAGADSTAAKVQAAVGNGEQLPVDQQEDPVVDVAKVTGLKKTTTNINNINLVWDAAENVDGFNVYRCSADYDNGRYRKVADVTENTYNDTKLVQGSPYYYKVAAYVIKDGEVIEGEPTLYKTATQPAKVTGVTRVRSSDVIELKWNRNSKATGYKILRSSPESGNKEVLYKVIEGGSNTKFVDTDVKLGNIYTYNVVAVRGLYGSALYHSPGNRITCLAGLCAPNFTVTSKLYRGFLTWKRNAYATRYDIYYSTDRNATAYTKAGSTTGTSFMTGKLRGNKTLYFRVYPIYKGSTTITGTSHTKEVAVSGYIFGQKPGSTYIEVNIEKQTMWFYKNGKLVVETPVVTGNRYTSDTPKGFFSIYSRATNTVLVGANYASPVDYWMAFKGGCGIHDASWRSYFGGTIYQGNGSHGCVNTPYNAVRTIYNNTGYGTPVIVY